MTLDSLFYLTVSPPPPPPPPIEDGSEEETLLFTLFIFVFSSRCDSVLSFLILSIPIFLFFLFFIFLFCFFFSTMLRTLHAHIHTVYYLSVCLSSHSLSYCLIYIYRLVPYYSSYIPFHHSFLPHCVIHS